jgi:hypothetical protein
VGVLTTGQRLIVYRTSSKARKSASAIKVSATQK